MNVFISVSLVLMIHLYGVGAYPSGAPQTPEVCRDMEPSAQGHNSTGPQNGISPYNITVSPNKITSADQELTVTITGTNGTTFRGFLLQARRVPTPGTFGPTVIAAVGAFSDMLPKDTKHVNCNSKPKGALTHSARLGGGNGVNSLSVKWKPDSTGGNIKFWLTTVQVRQIYWIRELSSVVEIQIQPSTATTVIPSVTTGIPSNNTTPGSPSSSTTIYITLMPLLLALVAQLLLQRTN